MSETKTIKISKLRPNTGQIDGLPKNPRFIRDERFEKLKQSIKDLPSMLDLRELIVVPQNGHFVTIGGNMRLRAAKDLGFDELPCKVLPAETDANVLAEIAIKDNVGFGQDDYDILSNEWTDFPLTDWGMEIPELETVEPAGEADAEPQMDKAAELNKKWGVRSGDLWQIGEHRLICGDSTSPQAVEAVLDGAKPNLMVTDPPYGVEYENGKGKVHNDDQADWTLAYLKFPGNVAYVWHSDRFSLDIGLNLRSADFEIRAQIIWCKKSPVMSRGHYNYQHEGCWYGVKRGQKSRWKGDMTQSTFWKMERGEADHPTVKPLEAMMRPIGNHEGDVYEPFAGSGTTLVAAENLGRTCYAIELSPDYCAVVLERMHTAFPGIEIKRLEQAEAVSG